MNSGEQILKFGRLVVFLTAVILLMGARVDAALSLEARAAIEEMRARVNQNNQVAVTEESADGQYIPGKELYTVLAKYRSRIYGAPEATDNRLAHWRVSVEDRVQTSAAGYRAGSMLEKALVNYRTQRKVFNLVKVLKAKESSERDDNDSAEPPAALSVNVPVSVNSSELLTQSKNALQESVEGMPKSGNVQAIPSLSEASTDSSVEPASASSVDNSEVQKYEFRMPRNYRIMVK